VKIDKAVFRLMIGIISMCCLTSLFAFPLQAWASKELDVPYIRQVGDTADEFDGRWACGATSAVMIVAYYNKLPSHRISVNMCGFHYSDYGWYVAPFDDDTPSTNYSSYGYTFNEFSEKEADPGNDQVYGAYGYIHDYCYDGTPGCAHAEFAKGYFRRHGLFSKVVYYPTEAEVKDEIDKGHPVWASTNLWKEYGHVVVIKGYTDEGYLIVNDPWPYDYDWCYMGSDMRYTWNKMETGSKLIVIADPIRPGDTVEALYNDIRIRSGPGLSFPQIGYVGSIGTVVDDYTYGCFYNSDGYTWWKIQWDNGLVGWSACGDNGNRNGGDNWIEKVTTTETLSVSLTADPSSGNGPLNVTFTADVSGTATGTINYTFWWNCDNSGTSVEEVTAVCGDPTDPTIGAKFDGVWDDSKTVTHTYWDTGTYTAKVIVERGSAAPAEGRVTITVTPSPNHDPELSSGDVDPDSGDTSTTFTYTVKYYDQDGDSPSAKYVYIDGSPHTMSLYTGSASNGTYRYRTTLSAGSHNYYFYFTDGNGGSDRLPSSRTYSGPIVTEPNHSPNTPSTPSGPSAGYVGTSYTFSTSATDPDGDPIEYRFNWGDGNVSDWGGSTQSHSWLSPDNYCIKAQARDSHGATSGWSSCHYINITSSHYDPPVVSHFTAYPTDGYAPLTVWLSCSAYDPDGYIVKHEIDFGDGSNHYVGSNNSTNHTYNNAGTYYPKARVQDNDGLWSDWYSLESNNGKIDVYGCLTPGTPSSPNPSNHATDVSIDTDLDWSDCANTDSYDVYFGECPNPEYRDTASGSSYNLPTLDYDTHYCWQIIANNNCGNNTPGPVWDFTTVQAPQPDISISPTSYNFGLVYINESSSKTFTISNNGSADLDIYTIDIIGTDFSDFYIQKDDCSGQTLAPSGNCIVDVVFSPTSVGENNANLSIRSNDPDTPILIVPLSGTGISVFPGDCNGDGTVSIDEVQKCINCFLSIENDCCDKCDVNSNDQVTIDEVQKIINAFLGK